MKKRSIFLYIDDSLARKIAKLQSLKFTGTAGILVKAKEKGLINEVKPILDLLKDKRFFLREKVIADILKLSGEV